MAVADGATAVAEARAAIRPHIVQSPRDSPETHRDFPSASTHSALSISCSSMTSTVAPCLFFDKGTRTWRGYSLKEFLKVKKNYQDREGTEYKYSCGSLDICTRDVVRQDSKE